MAFEIDTTGWEDLCTVTMVTDHLAEVEEFPGSDFDDEDKIAELIVMGKAYLEEKSGRHILWKDVVRELHDGHEKTHLFPRRKPILHVTSVIRIAPDGTETTLIASGEDQEYWAYSERIEFRAPLVAGHQNYALSYRTGVAGTVSLITAMAISTAAALHVVTSIGSGGTLSEAITAGPVSIRDVYPANGKYASKVRDWKRAISEWAAPRGAVRLGVVEGPGERGPLRYYPRQDRWDL